MVILRVWKKYIEYIDRQPALTKYSSLRATTGCIITGFGDTLTQKYIEKHQTIDWRRTVNLGSYGFFACAIGHFWYKFLDNAAGPSMSIKIALKKLILDQLMLAPAEVFLVFAWTQVGMGKTDQLLPKLKSNFLPLLLANYMIWVPAQSINFLYIPQKHRVLWQSIVMVLWSTCLSYASNNNLR